MKQFGIILKFELKSYLKNKIFVGVTVVLALLIIAVMFFPRIKEVFETEKESKSSSEEEVMLIKADSLEQAEMLEQSFATSFSDYEVKCTDKSEQWIEEQITDNKVECAFVMTGDSSYTYYVNNLSMSDMNTVIADELLQNVYRMNALVSEGISPEQANEIMTMQIEHEVTTLGKDQSENFFYTYIMIFALYIVILLYGQMVASNVATEKSSRAMELLITSANPTSMMFGKVIASCIAGLIQLITIFGSAFISYNANESYWGKNEIIASIFDIPLELLMYMLIFFILGFFIYAFLYGAIGSTASKVEDINTSVMPLTFLFIIAFMVVMFSMAEGTVDNMAMMICSYMPFTSPMAMFTRIAMSTVPKYEIIISITVLLCSVIGVGIFSAKIYRVGVLLYGMPPKISSIIKEIRKA